MINALLLDAMRAALKGHTVTWKKKISDAQWQALFQQANTHQVLPLVFQATAGAPAAQYMNPQLFARTKQTVIHQIAVQVQKNAVFGSVYQYLRKQGLCPILVKGTICRNLYPDPDLRCSGDEDILIGPNSFLSCHEALLNYGLHVGDSNADIQNDYEVPYLKEGSHLFIELHRYLFPPESRAYGSLNTFFTAEQVQTILVTVDGVELITFAPNDHLFYLICHAFKHFIHCGFGIRQICDIALFIQHYNVELNWEQLYNRCRQIHAETFVEAILKIAQNHLGVVLDTACWPAQWQQATIDESALLEDLLTSGIFGYTSQSRVHSSNMTLDAVADSLHGSTTKYSLRTSLFPSRNYLEKRYQYLKKYPILLPVAWCSRIIAYGKKAMSPKNNAADALRIGKDRIDLLRQYKIII